MLISKQEFSKLSQKDKNQLIRNQPKKKKAKAQSKPKGKAKSKKQASVAAAYATQTLGKAPSIKATRDTCRVSHREFIGNITGSVNFTIAYNLAVNPGQSATFPWLSVMAQGWEQYHFNSLKFCYYTRTSSNTNGSLIMAPDYDSADVAPVTEQIMSTFVGCAEDAPWKDNCCVVKAQLAAGPMKRHFVRTAPLANNLDIKTYDVANFLVATVDGTASAWGKLWVEYDVTFWVPQIPPQGIVFSGGLVSGGGTLSPAKPLGTAATYGQNTNGLIYDPNLSNVSFQYPGTYLVDYALAGTGLTNLALTNAQNCTISPLNSVINGAGTLGISTYQVLVNSLPAALALASTATTITQSGFTCGSAPYLSL